MEKWAHRIVFPDTYATQKCTQAAAVNNCYLVPTSTAPFYIKEMDMNASGVASQTIQCQTTGGNIRSMMQMVGPATAPANLHVQTNIKMATSTACWLRTFDGTLTQAFMTISSTSSPSSQTELNFLNFHEMLFIIGVLLFIVAFQTWGYLFKGYAPNV